jgi:hypothetical protein
MLQIRIFLFCYFSSTKENRRVGILMAFVTVLVLIHFIVMASSFCCCMRGSSVFLLFGVVSALSFLFNFVGAMENWGLITYRETCLLVDPENTSTVQKQWIALTVGHEIAHQWFGNLVTMVCSHLLGTLQ